MSVSTLENSSSRQTCLTPVESSTDSERTSPKANKTVTPKPQPTRRKLWLATGAFAIVIATAIALALGTPRDNSDTATAEDIYRRCAESVYTIDVFDGVDWFALGTGFAVTRDGVIATNYHVIQGGQWATVRTADGQGSLVLGVIAYDTAADLALLKIDAHNDHPLPLSSVTPPAGKQVVALGNPHGMTNSLSRGIVSSVDTDESSGFHRVWFDAAISPGSSGGPVLDMEGNVIGVASGSIEEEGAQNLNCAISSIRLKQLLDNADTSTSINTIAGLSAALLPTGAVNSSLDHWLNTRSNVRHNSTCRYYKNTAQGRPCRENEGRACKVCGG